MDVAEDGLAKAEEGQRSGGNQEHDDLDDCEIEDEENNLAEEQEY